jgi:hypothetical protein
MKLARTVSVAAVSLWALDPAGASAPSAADVSKPEREVRSVLPSALPALATSWFVASARAPFPPGSRPPGAPEGVARWSVSLARPEGTPLAAGFVSPRTGHLVDAPPEACELREEGGVDVCDGYVHAVEVVAGPVDLDGDGGPEWFVEATIARTWPPRHERAHTLLSLRSGAAGAAPTLMRLPLARPASGLWAPLGKPAVVTDRSAQQRVVARFDGRKLVESLQVHPLLAAARKARPVPAADSCDPTDPRRDPGLFQCVLHDLGGSSSLERITVEFDAESRFNESVVTIADGSIVLYTARVARPRLEAPGAIAIQATREAGYHDVLLRDPEGGDDRLLRFTGSVYTEPTL